MRDDAASAPRVARRANENPSNHSNVGLQMGQGNLCELLGRLARRKVSDILQQNAFVGTCEMPRLTFRFRRWIAPIHIALNHQRRSSDGFDGGESQPQGLVSLI